MGYAFKIKIKGYEKTPRQIEKETDFVLGYARGKRSNSWGGGASKVYRPRKQKSCYCGGHSTGKGTLDSHSELNRWWTRMRRKAKVEMKRETERLYGFYGGPTKLFEEVYYKEATGAETGMLPEAVL